MDYINITDSAFLNNFGEKIAKHRLNKNMTQAQLAIEAGVSIATIQRLEKGDSIQLLKFIRILRALYLLENFDMSIPQTVVSPIQQIKVKNNSRQRASSREKMKSIEEWSWGDEK